MKAVTSFSAEAICRGDISGSSASPEVLVCQKSPTSAGWLTPSGPDSCHPSVESLKCDALCLRGTEPAAGDRRESTGIIVMYREVQPNIELYKQCLQMKRCLQSIPCTG